MTISTNRRRPVIIGPDTPTWAKTTDVWVNTLDNTLYRYDGSQWDVIGSYGASVSAVGGFTQEQIEDFAAAMLNHANHTNLTASYNDSTGQIILVGASASGGGGGSAGISLLHSANFTAQSSIAIPQGTFTSTYNDYKIKFVVTSSSTSNALGLRLSASGSQNSGDYFTVRDGGSSERSNWDRFVMTETEFNRGTGQFYDIDLYAPALSTKTFFRSSVYGFNGTQQQFYQYGGAHNIESAFDSARIYITDGGGTVSGYYSVYGFNK